MSKCGKCSILNAWSRNVNINLMGNSKLQYISKRYQRFRQILIFTSFSGQRLTQRLSLDQHLKPSLLFKTQGVETCLSFLILSESTTVSHTSGLWPVNGLNPGESVCVCDGRSSKLLWFWERLLVTDLSTASAAGHLQRPMNRSPPKLTTAEAVIRRSSTTFFKTILTKPIYYH